MAGQEASQQAGISQPHAVKAGKKKQKGGKKAAAKGSKAASGSLPGLANAEDIVTVDFFVPDQDEQDKNLEIQGRHLLMLYADQGCTMFGLHCRANINPA